MYAHRGLSHYNCFEMGYIQATQNTLLAPPVSFVDLS